MKKNKLAIALAAAMTVALMGSCAGTGDPTTSGGASGGSTFDTTQAVHVYTREAGSGTRSAFTELVGLEEEDADGNTTDLTTEEAATANNTQVMMTSIASDPYAIGYISLGSLSDEVKAVSIDGVAPTADNVKSGNYAISRPFNIATNGEAQGLAKDFIDFILSQEGQNIITEEGYISVVDNATAFQSTLPEGSIVVGGSSSVSPVMEKLAEAYEALNANANIDVMTTDSTAGMNNTMEGTYDIGMASRELKESETASLTGIQIAQDGIAVIVNNQNTVENLTMAQVKDIYTGTATAWNNVA